MQQNQKNMRVMTEKPVAVMVLTQRQTETCCSMRQSLGKPRYVYFTLMEIYE